MARTSLRTHRDLLQLGENLRAWRKIHGLTAQLVADRAGITRTTLRGIETGTGAASLENVLAVLRVLGVADAVVSATDPLTTEMGRFHAERTLPQRVRIPR
ncbi:helix-turn-helix transcriptional regulator [Antribacter gilvus]|uniref:helix-turn-helix transcriptional regulator n=1 Tax=Antribacter gilvus TaxID=2304675 RepID=UPI000F796F99|nr:helix-turn-helix transcriptional regulator [Antribacter gilvus]